MNRGREDKQSVEEGKEGGAGVEGKGRETGRPRAALGKGGVTQAWEGER